jgi:hypothetical protein
VLEVSSFHKVGWAKAPRAVPAIFFAH